MTEQYEGESQNFVLTKAYRRFAEMCDGCRRTHVVGLGYRPPGTGKTESAEQYAQWNLFKPFLPEPLITFTGRNAVDGLYPYRPLTFASVPLDVPIQHCRTVFYTPPIAASASRIEKEVLTLFAAFSYLVEAANQLHQGNEEFLVTRLKKLTFRDGPVGIFDWYQEYCNSQSQFLPRQISYTPASDPIEDGYILLRKLFPGRASSLRPSMVFFHMDGNHVWSKRASI